MTQEKNKQEKKPFQKKEEAHEACARLDNVSISTKDSIEICNFIRYKPLIKAKQMLQKVLEKKIAVPFKRYNLDLGHKPGIASGRYPEKPIKEILKLLDLVQANAENKGLDGENLVITKLIANKGLHQMHYGRKRSRRFKRTHLEIFVKEI